MFHLTITFQNLHRRTLCRKYRVEQYYTTGWSIVDEEAIKLSKDEARKWLEKIGRRSQS